ncbi:HAMP domain-containing histidine kinase [bacterium]|nr:HAMP domain-containing histidine kinase [bacterium]
MQKQELTIEDLNQQIRCVSHEIRNHLSICDMYSQIIKRHLEKEGISNNSIENALDCIQKSIQIIGTNLLELKSLNQNTPQVIDFSKIITKGANLAKAYVIDKDIEFEIFVKNTDYIYIDENKFLACIVNILKNGIESIEGKGTIEVLAEIKENFGIIKLSNNGKPIPKDKQQQIFKQGYTTKTSGCGIGLALCKNFLEASGATLTLTQSTKAKTTFEIRVPVAQ